MCEFCEESKNRKDIDDNGEIKVRLNEQMGNNLEIDYYHYGAKVGRYIPIAYCPMCGRLVNKELLQATAVAGMEAGTPASAEVKAPVINDFSQEIAKAITEAVDPTNIANNITKNIMRGGMY